ncbi:ribosome biogenesis GTP-binding protein YihA/YsxC [Salirhabdus salicampi]|uniref:ribosome biogenesis GTP-binding protein YihA/YsxC n=1 Tax=Salirhabdus salicampi TaxID=476102 RepID=UPI0020C5198D|nr:ribosome biogenesis GTP-binding protein YihA/YsxC [Salirhabdus salicampi]MCP8617030.1 ribosome biogenesis GTP-binding protein YihA/YsxC [Salirhabdus salicampi]
MKVNQAEIVISAVKEEQYPNDRLPEICLAGRSNVGKSSFINKMIQRKGLARTSAKPGKTQTLNFYRINEKFYFVDVPGYGYAKVSKKERAAWGKMMETYFSKREPLVLAVLIVDLRHKPTEDDLLMYDFFKHYDLRVMVVATKLDKVPRSKRAKHLKQVREVLDIEEGDHLVTFSAETSEGRDEAWGIIKSYL